ncbi:MAG: GNAT family N-acetyltransferase [Pseudomonadota bacterium]
MKFVCFTDWTQLPKSANVLFDKGTKENMSFSRPWFENLVDTALKTDQSMLLACVTEGDTMLAILPLIQQTDGHWESLSHSYSTHYTILFQGSEKSQTLACLASGLNLLPFKTLRLKPFDENDQKVHGLRQAMENIGISCHLGFRFYNWSYSLQGQSFEQYMARRPGSVRNTIARKERKLEREQGYHIRLFTDQQVPQAMADYNVVYKASWKAAEVSKDIMVSLIERFAKMGWLRLAVLYIQGQPVAAQIWFVVHSKASIFRLAYDESWKQYSPGSILTKFLMEYVIDTDKVDEIDFLTGNERYKQDWMSQRNARWEMVCANTRKPRKISEQFIESLKGFLKIN